MHVEAVEGKRSLHFLSKSVAAESVIEDVQVL